MDALPPLRGTGTVALLAEGVDRNFLLPPDRSLICFRSPSSRRAWIEIVQWNTSFRSRGVALLAEGVDRNTQNQSVLSASWVALLAEGVDRNDCFSANDNDQRGRPPRGGRG